MFTLWTHGILALHKVLVPFQHQLHFSVTDCAHLQPITATANVKHSNIKTTFQAPNTCLTGESYDEWIQTLEWSLDWRLSNRCSALCILQLNTEGLNFEAKYSFIHSIMETTLMSSVFRKTKSEVSLQSFHAMKDNTQNRLKTTAIVALAKWKITTN